MLAQIQKISLVSFGNVFNAILGLVFLTSLARNMPTEDFGKYALLSVLLVSFSKIIDFGTNSVYVAKSITDNTYSKEIFVTTKILLLTLSIVLSVPTLFYLDLWGNLIFLYFCIGLFAYTVNLTLFAYFQKIEKFHLVVGLNTLPAIVKGLAGTMVFLGLLNPNVNLGFAVFACSMLLSGLFYWLLPPNYRGFNISDKKILDLLKESYPAGISIFITNGWSAISSSIAKIVKSFSDVGVFAVADKVANIFTLLSVSIFTVLLPKNAKRKEQNQKYDVPETVLISFGIIFLAIIFIIAAKFLVPIIFGLEFAESENILGIMIMASALTAIHNFIDNYFFVEEKVKTLMLITVGKLVLFVPLALYLGDILGILGVAYAQLATAFISVSVTYYYFLSRVYKLR